MNERPPGNERELAMFPLGTTLLPGMVLPLRIFEPRYREMMAAVRAAEPAHFGVVLIERGSEVGGGDVRTDVGCLAEVQGTRDLPGGELAVVAVGTERLQVVRWLEDDPYPRAMVRSWPDDDEDHPPEAPATLREAALESARTAVRLAGGELPEELGLSADPRRQVYELATLTPLGPLDRLRVLSAPSLAGRIELLGDLVHEQRILLEARSRFSDEQGGGEQGGDAEGGADG